MMSTESIHRRLGLNNDTNEFLKRKEAPLKSFLASEGEEAAEGVVPCVTEDEEDEMALAPPQTTVHKEEPAYIDYYQQEEEEKNYGVETYLNHYEIMLQRQEDENVATLAHLKPMLEVLEALARGRNTAVIPNTDIIYYDRTTLLKEFQFGDLQKAVNRLQVRDTQFDFIQTDRQFMLVLKLLTETNSAKTSQSISWAEIAHCYRICVTGMQTLQDLPQGRIRMLTRERTMSSLQLFRNDIPKDIRKSFESMSQPSPSPLKSTRTRATMQPVPEEIEMHQSNLKEISFLKLVIAFLLGLTITTMTVAMFPRTPTTSAIASSSIDLLLEQMLQNANAASTAIAASEDNSSFVPPISSSSSHSSSVPPLMQAPSSPKSVPLSSELTAQPKRTTTKPTPISVITQTTSTPKNTSSETSPSRPSKRNRLISLFPMSLSSNEKKAMLSVAGISIVGPAVVQAVMALSSTTPLLSIGMTVLAATLVAQGIRDFFFGWVPKFHQNKASKEE
jgi:hypothetical protein